MFDLRSLLDQVDEALEGGELDRGLELVRSALGELPESAELQARLGRLHLHAFRYGEAIEPLERALALAPEHSFALQDLGVALRYEGDVLRALDVHQRLRRALPDERQPRLSVALTLTVMGRPAEALPELESLVAEEPRDASARLGLARALVRLGRFAEASRLLDALLEQVPGDIDALTCKFEAAFHLQRTDEWVQAARQAHERFPENPVVQYQMHFVRLAEGNFRAALAHLQRALELHPHCVEALVGLGNMHWMLDDPDAAQRSLELAASLAPWHGAAAGMLARFQAATGCGRPEVVRLAREARACPHSGLPYHLGRLYREQWRDAKRAEQFFELAIANSPELVGALLFLGDLLLEQGRAAEAILRYRRVLELSPELGEAWNGLALALARAGRTNEALQAYAEAVRRTPDDPSVLQGYGAAHLEAGQPEQALPLLERALQRGLRSGRTLFLLATALERVGRPIAAQERARQAHKWLPKDEDVLALLARLQHIHERPERSLAAREISQG